MLGCALPLPEKHQMMSWLTSPSFSIPVAAATILLILFSTQQKYKRVRPLIILILVLCAITLACLAPKTDATPVPKTDSSGLQPSGSMDAGTPEPQPLGPDAGVPGPLDPGCSDPKTCGEPRIPRQVHPLDSRDAGAPDPLDPGCSDPKTCGEPRPPFRPTGSDGGV